MKYLFSIFTLILMIIVHEFGHFIAGRIVKIPIYEFSIGFGKKIFQYKSKTKETLFSIRIIPLGGYCAFDDPKSKNISDTELDKLPLYKQIFVCLAGPIFNIIFAFIILFISSICIGKLVPTSIISDIVPNSPASNYFEVGDEIIEVGNVKINGNGELINNEIDANIKFLPQKFTVNRNGQIVSFYVTPIKNENGQPFIGITRKIIRTNISLKESFTTSLDNVISYTLAIFSGFKDIFVTQNVNDISGIVGAIYIMSEFLTIQYITIFVSLVAFISINLAIINLLPIPGLDGSRILQYIIEAITKRRINRQFLNKATFVCFSLLIGFMFIVIINDIVRISGGI